MDYEQKYLKYKKKYLELKNNQIGGSKFKDLMSQINVMEQSSIFINETIKGSSSKEQELIIIPGFSDSSYTRNYQTLFEFYDQKLNVKKWKRVHLIKFKDNVKNLQDSFFNRDTKPETIIDGRLENRLYEKLAELLLQQLDQRIKYTILSKSAGCGVGIYLYKFLNKDNRLFLFAPGVKYIDFDIRKLQHFIRNESNVVVGWNVEDTKVKMSEIWPILSQLLPKTHVLTYNKDFNSTIDTQHEINSKFIEQICPDDSTSAASDASAASASAASAASASAASASASAASEESA